MRPEGCNPLLRRLLQSSQTCSTARKAHCQVLASACASITAAKPVLPCTCKGRCSIWPLSFLLSLLTPLYPAILSPSAHLRPLLCPFTHLSPSCHPFPHLPSLPDGVDTLTPLPIQHHDSLALRSASPNKSQLNKRQLW